MVLIVWKPEECNKDTGEHSISRANHRLAIVQDIYQKFMKAGCAQVKVKFALATSRRSAARGRHGRGIRCVTVRLEMVV